MKLDQAKFEQHYRTHRYDFEVVNPDTDDTSHVYLTTADAKAVADTLAAVGSTIEIVAVHPEFLGWTVEEIEGNWTDA